MENRPEKEVVIVDNNFGPRDFFVTDMENNKIIPNLTREATIAVLKILNPVGDKKVYPYAYRTLNRDTRFTMNNSKWEFDLSWDEVLYENLIAEKRKVGLLETEIKGLEAP